MSKQTFTIQALQLEDVPAAAQLSSDAFLADRQTQMKALGRNPYDLKKHHLESLPQMLKSSRCVILKAVDDATGEFAGFCNWGFAGFSADEMPELSGRIRPPEKPATASSQPSVEKKPSKEKKPSSSDQGAAEPDATPEAVADDPIERLQKLTGSDLDAWQKEVMPPGTKCLIVIGLSVSPKFQRRGIGSALLRWGTSICDQTGCFAWVHSSEPAWPIYAKAGFQVIRSLDVDLDAYAPCPPPDEGPDAKWGHYVFRYMKYYGSKD